LIANYTYELVKNSILTIKLLQF